MMYIDENKAMAQGFRAFLREGLDAECPYIAGSDYMTAWFIGLFMGSVKAQQATADH